jgi:hypothetical protein
MTALYHRIESGSSVVVTVQNTEAPGKQKGGCVITGSWIFRIPLKDASFSGADCDAPRTTTGATLTPTG